MPTLDEVAVAFEEWRLTKKKKWERVPEELIEKAKSLLGEHPVGTVSFRLGIKPQKLSNPVESDPTPSEPKFIEVPGAAAILGSDEVTIRIRPESKNEISISVPSGNVNWVELLKGLSKL